MGAGGFQTGRNEEMIDIRRIRKSTGCIFCDKKAVKTINGLPFCPHCLDGRLVRIIAACTKATEEIVIKFQIIPRSVYGKKSV